MQLFVRFGALALFILLFTVNIHAQAVTVSTIAGNGALGFSGDGSLAATASFSNQSGVAVDSAANVYVPDTGNNRIRKITPGGTINTVEGGGANEAGVSQDSG